MHMTSEGVAPRGLQLHDFITERTRNQPRQKWREVSHDLEIIVFLCIILRAGKVVHVSSVLVEFIVYD